MARLNGIWSSSSASISWSNSMSISPLRSGTLAIVRTPGPGGMRTQRSGAITPRRAAWARSKREVWVGKRSVTWRAISAPVAVMPMKIGPSQRADRLARLLAQRGVGLVADDDRVGVGDLADVAHEPLVGLDGDRAIGLVLVAQQGRRDPLGVAAVAQLAVELVDEVAAVGEDQDAAGARGLDEAERRDGLAGAGGVLEPEALGRVGVLGRVDDVGVDDLLVVVLPVHRLLGLVVVLVVRPPRRGSRPDASCVGSSAAARPLPAPLPLPLRCASASSAISVPDSASTWCAERTAPSARWGSSSESTRSRPSSSEYLRRHSGEGSVRPASSSASAASSACRRGVPGPIASSGDSSSWTNCSRANFSARAISAGLGRSVAGAATRVDSAMKACYDDDAVRR